MKLQYLALRQNEEMWENLIALFIKLYEVKPKFPTRVFLLYAWPDIEKYKGHHWIQLMLTDIAVLLEQAGIRSLIDLRNIHESRDVHSFCSQANDAEYVLVFGEPTLVAKYNDQQFHPENAALSHMQQKQHRDLKANSNRLFPIILAGDQELSLPTFMYWHKSLDWTTGNLVMHLKNLLQLIVNNTDVTWLFNDEWDKLNEHFLEYLKIQESKLDLEGFLNTELVQLHKSAHYAAAIKVRRFDSALPILGTQAAEKHPSVTMLRKGYRVPTLHQFYQSRYTLSREIQFLMNAQINADNRAVCLLGPPGIGKTQLAIQYALSVMDEYDYVLWLGTEGDDDNKIIGALKKQFASIAQKLGKDLIVTSDAKECTVFVFNCLKKYRVLVIYDNVSSPHLISAFLPQTQSKVSILATSRNMSPQAWNDQFLPIHVGPFEPHESTAYLQSYLDMKVKKYTQEQLIILHQFVTGVPLLLSQTLMCILNNTTIESLLKNIRHNPMLIISHEVNVKDYYRIEKQGYSCYAGSKINALTVLSKSYNQLSVNAQSLLNQLILLDNSLSIDLYSVGLNSQQEILELLSAGLIVPVLSLERIIIPRQTQLVVSCICKLNLTADKFIARDEQKQTTEKIVMERSSPLSAIRNEGPPQLAVVKSDLLL